MVEAGRGQFEFLWHRLPFLLRAQSEGLVLRPVWSQVEHAFLGGRGGAGVGKREPGLAVPVSLRQAGATESRPVKCNLPSFVIIPWPRCWGRLGGGRVWMREGGQRQGSAGKPGELLQSQVLPLVNITFIMWGAGAWRGLPGERHSADFLKDRGRRTGPGRAFLRFHGPQCGLASRPAPVGCLFCST